MITSWRIVNADYAGDAFSGKGAYLYGGRWNHEGTLLVYTAQSASLAALEMLVRLRSDDLLRGYLLFACSYEESLLERIDVADLPDDWRTEPAPLVLKDMGESWVRSDASAVLRVPSAVMPTEFNYLLNPPHRDFKKIEIADPVPFSLDLRLLRR